MGRLVDLKRQWGVSIQALVERAYQLKVLTAGQRTSIYKQLSRMGWRIREPISDELLVEHPHLTESITQALIGKGFSLQEIAKLAGFADADHNSMFKPAGPALRVVLSSWGGMLTWVLNRAGRMTRFLRGARPAGVTAAQLVRIRVRDRGRSAATRRRLVSFARSDRSARVIRRTRAQ